MRTLATGFKRYGFEFTQIDRCGMCAIYDKKNRDGIGCFEVIVIRCRGAREVFGKLFEASEYYPASEEWGQFGWTYPDLSGAKERFADLIERHRVRDGGSTVKEVLGVR